MTDTDLDFWIENELNVLMVGKHGVGKTARIVNAFERAGMEKDRDYLYFSASTLDPWVDFIGVPKETTDEDGNTFLDLVRPKAFATDSVKAIFLDEANRAPKKVRNAMMELIQFKSINGKSFKNLKIVWAAINPEDEDEDGDMAYDVEVLDPAQKDRFQVQVELPYSPDKKYFEGKFGKDGLNAIDWWKSLDAKVQDHVSPRRLDYVLEYHEMGGNLRHILPNNANVTKLIQELDGGSFKIRLRKILKDGTPEERDAFINEPNNFDNCIDEIAKNEANFVKFVDFIDAERMAVIMNRHPNVLTYVDGRLEEDRGLLQATENAVARNTELQEKVKKKS